MNLSNWNTAEEYASSLFTRVVYSDDEEFHTSTEPWPEKIVFVTKEGIYSYVMKYNVLLGTFVHYKIPHYNRKYATIRLANSGDKASDSDVHGNEKLVDEYKVDF